MPIYPTRKNIRLKRELYQGPVVAAITICFYRGIDSVRDALADTIVDGLFCVQGRHKATIYAYCILPDHMHILLGIQDENYNILDFVVQFKSDVSFKLKGRYTRKQLWQDRFYDHVLRRGEDIDKHAQYILENPVRKGMVREVLEYQYIGGTYLEALKRHQRP